MYAYNRNSYLLTGSACMKDFNPRLMARILNKELSFHTTYRDLEPPFLKLASSMSGIYAPHVDVTRAKIAFGRWALPKLKKEIHNENVLVVMQALCSIHDLVHDPEKCLEAVKIGIVDRLVDLMSHKRDFIREKVCLIFCTIAGLEEGKKAILKRYKILHKLAMLIEDKVDAVKHKAQLVIELLSLSPVMATGLNEADFLTLILRLIGGTPKTENESILILHLATLKMLLDRDVKELALSFNAMNILTEKLNHTNETVRCLSLDCITLLCQTPMGRAEVAEKDLGVILCKKLYDPSLDVKIKAAGALAFATIQSEMRNKFYKKCTIEILIQLLENFHSSEGQLMASKVLANLSENPKGKKLVLRMKERIKNAYVNNVEVDRHKKILLNLLKN